MPSGKLNEKFIETIHTSVFWKNKREDRMA
jgi:hypothetical protein